MNAHTTYCGGGAQQSGSLLGAQGSSNKEYSILGSMFGAPAYERTMYTLHLLQIPSLSHRCARTGHISNPTPDVLYKATRL